MKALILDGTIDNDKENETLKEAWVEGLEEQGYQVNWVILKQEEIQSCIGCFNCWTKTPGLCIYDDKGSDLAEEIINSQLVIGVSPVIFGGYSPEMKKMLDRIIPLLMPFFVKKKGEVHHSPRYDGYPPVWMVGISKKKKDEGEHLFEALAKRNELNWHNLFEGHIWRPETENARDFVDRSMKFLEARR
jgi:multimeric flavodoxin WrbA